MVEPLGFRHAAMRWLDQRPRTRVDYAWTSQFRYNGERTPLMDKGRGIRRPAVFEAALAIQTPFTPPGKLPPYADEVGADGLQRYKYKGNNPNARDNVSLRRAFEQKLPIIWFFGVASGLYEPIYPVYVVGDEPQRLQFVLAVHEGQRFLTPEAVSDEDTRAYVERLTKQRLHQRVFRSQVLLAYGGRCSVCHIKHAELLDAAHIIADGQPNGQPVVPNGISMCKIHHAAFDASILGIRPDLTLHVRQDVLEEIDGWMLKGGIQGVHNKRLEVIPYIRSARPDPARLQERYDGFVAAS